MRRSNVPIDIKCSFRSTSLLHPVLVMIGIFSFSFMMMMTLDAADSSREGGS